MQTIQREKSIDEQVAELKERFRKIGIAEYRQSGLDEYESLVSYIREKNSFRYAFLREPYTRSKNMLWRLMKIDIWRPSLPMGYYGSPGFLFDYLGEDPLAEALKLADILMGKKYKATKLSNSMSSFKDRASMKKISEIYVEPTDAECEFIKQRNYGKITWKE